LSRGDGQGFANIQRFHLAAGRQSVRRHARGGGSVSLGRTLYAPVRELPIGAVNSALLFNAGMFALARAMWCRQWFVKV
jgi:hypothetical protein